jgi:hypothetical protein
METADEKSVAVELIATLRRRVVSVALASLLSGIAGFVLAFVGTPRVEVIGFLEIARNFRVDAEGMLKEELVVPAAVLAAQVNAGAFQDAEGGLLAKNALQLRRTRVIARVPVRTDNVELTVRADSGNAGTEMIRRVASLVSADHLARQQPSLERLEKRHALLQAELEELLKVSRQMEKVLAALAKDGKPRDGVQFFALSSMRLQSGREGKELERMRQSVADALALMKERRTRLIGNLIPYRASLLNCIALGIIAGLLGAFVATAIVMASAYRRALRAP